MFEDLEAHLDFVVLKNAPLDQVIGRPTLKRLGGAMDFQAEEVRLSYRIQEVLVPMLLDYARSFTAHSRTDSEEFTSDSSRDAYDQPEIPVKGEVVWTTRDHPEEDKGGNVRLEETNGDKRTRQQLAKKLEHLPDATREVTSELFVRKNVAAFSLHDLCSADVPYRHKFELQTYLLCITPPERRLQRITK